MYLVFLMLFCQGIRLRTYKIRFITKIHFITIEIELYIYARSEFYTNGLVLTN